MPPVADTTPPVGPDQQLIQAYDAGGFTVSGVRHDGPVLVLPERTLAWDVRDMAGLTAERLEAVRTAVPRLDLLLVGTGTRFLLLPPALRAAIRAWGVAVEAMATPAACRTYNVLLTEERRVAAALMVVEGG